MSSSIGYYYIDQFYSGTESAPDTLSLFIVTEEEESSLYIEHQNPIVHSIGYVLFLSILTGITRVVCAVEVFFDHIGKISLEKDDPHLKECRNAAQNFCRGTIEAIPLTGLFLFLYDIFCSKVIVQAQIEKELKEKRKEGKQCTGKAGIAFEGKIRTFTDLNELIPDQDFNNLSYEEKLDSLTAWMDRELNPDNFKKKGQL